MGTLKGTTTLKTYKVYGDDDLIAQGFAMVGMEEEKIENAQKVRNFLGKDGGVVCWRSERAL